jgi:hypothetical protein
MAYNKNITRQIKRRKEREGVGKERGTLKEKERLTQRQKKRERRE